MVNRMHFYDNSGAKFSLFNYKLYTHCTSYKFDSVAPAFARRANAHAFEYV
jgi:hypothetical protein